MNTDDCIVNKVWLKIRLFNISEYAIRKVSPTRIYRNWNKTIRTPRRWRGVGKLKRFSSASQRATRLQTSRIQCGHQRGTNNVVAKSLSNQCRNYYFAKCSTNRLADIWFVWWFICLSLLSWSILLSFISFFSFFSAVCCRFGSVGLQTQILVEVVLLLVCKDAVRTNSQNYYW